jgi:hypothetical protein
VGENQEGDDDHDDSIANLATLLRELHLFALPVFAYDLSLSGRLGNGQVFRENSQDFSCVK